MRNPLYEPQWGDVVQSPHYDGKNQVGRRLVLSATPKNICYLTGTGRQMVERNCLPATWRKWCRAHKAYVVTDAQRDY